MDTEQQSKSLSDELYSLGEQVKACYAKSLIYEDALEFNNVTEEQRNALEDNKYYWSGIQRIEFDAKSILTETMLRIVKVGKPSEQLAAVKMLGEIIYPSRYGKANSRDENNVKD